MNRPLAKSSLDPQVSDRFTKLPIMSSTRKAGGLLVFCGFIGVDASSTDLLFGYTSTESMRYKHLQLEHLPRSFWHQYGLLLVTENQETPFSPVSTKGDGNLQGD